MPTPSHKIEDLSREELIALIRKLADEVEKLRKENEELRRKRYRQAAPFTKGFKKPDPKKPGRRKGEGQFQKREAPPAAETDVRVEASMPERCRCGGQVSLERIEEATMVDVPAVPVPVVTRYTVPVCRCEVCGGVVRGQAPGLEPDQLGATAHRLGPRVKAIAHTLHYGLGIPVRKLPQVLWELTGIRITASALTQDALKHASAEGPVGRQYQTLRDRIGGCAVVHTDDTGWSIGGTNAFLMGFVSADTVVYQIRYRHRSEEVLEIIPANFAGVMVTDRGKSYDADVFLHVLQQKCLGHLLKNISEVLEGKAGPARSFGLKLKSLLQRALELGDQEPSPERAVAVKRLDEELTWVLRNRVLKDDDNQRLLNGIGAQMDLGRLLTFLNVLGVDGTNNIAERILRLAVIARKVSQCSKNEAGAHASSAFMSVIQTLRIGLAPLASLSTLLLGVMVEAR